MSEELIAVGKALPIVEEFYSIQGEGFHTGKASYFIRIGGCDVGCSWCDTQQAWDSERYPPIHTDEIIKNIVNCPAKSVVVTGGEPLLYNLDYLCDELYKHNITSYLETSGSNQLSGEWDWICLSPKQNKAVNEDIFELANELKMIISSEEDLQWAEENAQKVNKDCILYLQPEWSNKNKMLPVIVQYILDNPKWKISNQTHKYIGIP